MENYTFTKEGILLISVCIPKSPYKFSEGRNQKFLEFSEVYESRFSCRNLSTRLGDTRKQSR